MNITIFIGGLSGGGAERVVCNLSNFLSERHHVTILTMSNDTPAYALNDSINRTSLINKGESQNYLIKNFRRLFRFRKYLRESKADIYLAMLPGTINLMLAHRSKINVPVIISERCDPYTRYDSSKVRKLIMKRLYPKADGFVFQTNEAMNYYKPIILSKGVVIPNAINHEFVRQPYKGKRKMTIVSAGRLTKQKNFPLLIKAFSAIAVKHPEYSLTIFGDGPIKGELIDLVKSLNLENKVAFPGYVGDFGDRIADASLFVLPSNYEGMPNALMEAMALALPCISTDCPVGGPRFLIDDNKNGMLVPVGNLDLLIQAMNFMLSNKSEAQLLGNNARNIVYTLDSSKIYALWEDYLQQVVSNSV